VAIVGLVFLSGSWGTLHTDTEGYMVFGGGLIALAFLDILVLKK